MRWSARVEPAKHHSFALLRLYDPTTVSFESMARICARTQKSLRQQIGLVTQETFLFHDTIFKNIQFGRLDATEEEVYAAARTAFAHDFIMAQPKGYETVIGDKGCLLSGGQQQRLAIARALLKNAPILLLDEATSALDSESEKQIQVRLGTTCRGPHRHRHRASSLHHSVGRQIVVMDTDESTKSARTRSCSKNRATTAASTICNSTGTKSRRGSGIAGRSDGFLARGRTRRLTEHNQTLRAH